MKKILILLAIVALVALLATCGNLFKTPTSINDCITSFMKDINSSDRSNVYTNLDSGSNLYSEAKTSLYWSAIFPTGETYTLGTITPIASTVTTTITSGVTYPGGYQIIFVMAQDSDKNYVIHSITIPNGPVPTAYN